MDIHCPPWVVAIVYYRNDLLEEAMTDTLRWYRVEETDMTTAREKWIEVKASQFAASAEPRSLEQTEQFARDAMALADQTRQEPSNPNVLDDGFGNQWLKCSRPGGCGLQIVRPGKVQCDCEREKQEDGAGDGDIGLKRRGDGDCHD